MDAEKVPSAIEYTPTGFIYHLAPDGPRTVEWDALRAVMIETNDAGPFATDLWWVLIDDTGHCIIPSDDGDETLLAKLQELPNFDNDIIIQAMASVENKLFLCWKRE